MRTNRLCILVRDAKTARILFKPPEDQLWLVREKSGLGRAVKHEWNTVRAVGPEFFKEVDDQRKWHFSFPEHCDVYVWDLAAGESYTNFYNVMHEESWCFSIFGRLVKHFFISNLPR